MISRFGDERIFASGSNAVRAIPKFVLPLAEDPVISEVIITKMDGERREIEHMAMEIKRDYSGALYSTWQRGIVVAV